MPDGSASTFTYDGDKRRRSKGESGSVTRFVRDGERVLVETDAGGTTQARYTVAGGGWFDRLLSLRRSGASRFYHLDALGSADRLTDASQGVTDSYLHKAFGILVTSTGSTINPFRFVAAYGYYRDPSTGLMQLGVRYYRDAMGRFLSRDPLYWRLRIGARQTRYGYSGNRPLRAVDPTGLKCESAWGPYGVGKCGSRKQPKLERTGKCGPADLPALYAEWLNSEAMRDYFCAGKVPRGGSGESGGVVARTDCCEDECGKCKGFIYPEAAWGSKPGCIRDCFARHEHVHKAHCEADRIRNAREWVDSECMAYQTLSHCLADYIDEIESG